MVVEYWEGENNAVPVLKFIQSIPEKAQAKVLKALDLLETDGTSLLATNNKWFRKMSGHQFYELRILFNKTYYRIFVALEPPGAWLIHGIIKKTDKTPDRDIQIVEERIKLIKQSTHNN